MTEALAKLAPSVSQWNLIPHGLTELTGAELAAVLAGLPREPYLMARACWIGDTTVLGELSRELLTQRASRYFRPEHVLYPGILRELCAHALLQAIEPPKCPTCEGRGEIWRRNALPVDCGSCNGTGAGLIGGESVRASLALSGDDWNVVKGGYQRLERVVWQWKARAAGHIRKKMR